MKGVRIEKVKGVNLGNWLVLEKWMSPELFAGTTAEDEYYLPTQLSPEVYEARIRQHRAEYITERDFGTIRALGLNTVRIPVPYFIFGDRPPFIGCIEQLDKAFAWAERYGLQILIDLHTAPLSQNGFDNGGISGVCKFFQMPDEIEFVYTVLERLAQRYADREGLWGIEILNEPVSEQMWTTMKVGERYKPVDPELAAGSRGYETEELRHFYVTAYERIRNYLPEDKYVVIHDGFDLTAWKDFMREDHFKNVVLDTHQYLMVAESQGCEQTLEGYVDFIGDKFGKPISEMQQYFPVVCGEWCLFNSLACGRDTKGGQTELNGEMEQITAVVSDEEKKKIYTALDRAQKAAWDEGCGYFYWSYKLLIDTVNGDSWVGWDAWDLGRCADFGWFEKEI
ncbi:MAG: cellulase family glycosylhydrolase [Lachnospiraceae bacterium]|nr:cellulase family glycosylhydrolase [Lachnospiraceae bacterium]